MGIIMGLGCRLFRLLPRFTCTVAAPPKAVTAVAVTILRRGQLHLDETEVLLIQREKEPYTGQWALPGGSVECKSLLSQTSAAHELRDYMIMCCVCSRDCVVLSASE